MTDTVLIDVAPNAQFFECGVFCVYHFVTVAVQIGQSGKAMLCGTAVFEFGVIAEKFRAVVDDTVSVDVTHQQSVIGGYPARGSSNATAHMVEQCACEAIGCNSFNAVAVQIEGERVVNIIFAVAVEFFRPWRKALVAVVVPALGVGKQIGIGFFEFFPSLAEVRQAIKEFTCRVCKIFRRLSCLFGGIACGIRKFLSFFACFVGKITYGIKG